MPLEKNKKHEEKEVRKGIPPKGCLLMLASFALGGAGMCAGYWLDCPFLKNIFYMGMVMAGGYIGGRYFNSARNQKKYTAIQWVGYFILAVILAGIFTWIETKNK